MKDNAISIRPFIGAKDFDISRKFYKEIGFQETVLSSELSLFMYGELSFYLQKFYVKDWVDNTMIFFEVENVDQVWEELSALRLPEKYEQVKVVPVRVESWGRVCFLHDPSGILLHFGQFL